MTPLTVYSVASRLQASSPRPLIPLETKDQHISWTSIFTQPSTSDPGSSTPCLLPGFFARVLNRNLKPWYIRNMRSLAITLPISRLDRRFDDLEIHCGFTVFYRVISHRRSYIQHQ